MKTYEPCWLCYRVHDDLETVDFLLVMTLLLEVKNIESLVARFDSLTA